MSRLSSKNEVLSTLRSILRYCASTPSSKKQHIRSEWCQQIIQQYRQNRNEKNDHIKKAMVTKASDYLILLNGIKEQKYYRTLDMGAEKILTPEEIVSRSARRVGLQVPEVQKTSEL